MESPGVGEAAVLVERYRRAVAKVDGHRLSLRCLGNNHWLCGLVRLWGGSRRLKPEMVTDEDRQHGSGADEG